MAEYCPLDIDQGEDWTVDIVWTDMFDEPVELSHPCRMDIRSKSGQIFAQLETNPTLPDGEVPSMNVSSSMGLIQLHMPYTQTQELLPGVEYQYDLFVTSGLTTDYGGQQRHRLLFGPVSVNKRTTRM